MADSHYRVNEYHDCDEQNSPNNEAEDHGEPSINENMPPIVLEERAFLTEIYGTTKRRSPALARASAPTQAPNAKLDSWPALLIWSVQSAERGSTLSVRKRSAPRTVASSMSATISQP